MTRPASILLLFMTVVTGCSSKASDAAPASDARATIDAMNEKALGWIAEGAVDSMVTSFYTSDAVFLNANLPAAKGTDAIRKQMDELLTMGKFVFETHPSSFVVSDSLATEYGTYTVTLTAKPPADTTKPLMTDHGNFLTTYIRRNGQWRALYDMSATDVPAPQPTPAESAKKK